MLCAREEIIDRRLSQRITEAVEAQYIPRKRGGVTGDIDDALRFHGGNGLDRLLRHALSRRIDHNDRRSEPPFGEHLRGLACVGT